MQAQSAVARAPAPATRPAGSTATQAQQSRTDQNSGDLHAIIVRLLEVLPADAGELPVEDVLAALRARDPESFTAVDRLSSAALTAMRLSDAEAEQWKSSGNAAFEKSQLPESICSYTQGLRAAETDGMLATLLNNRSTALYQQQRYADACLDAHCAFALSPTYWKALLRRGKALAALGFAELGAKDVAAAEALNADSANAAADMATLFGEMGVGMARQALPPHATLPLPIHVERSARGRGLVAKERLPGGQVALTETPYALAAKNESLLLACSYCLQFTRCLYHGEPFRRAGVKSRGFFCSDACALAAWRYYGERESKNAFFLCCPNDALLAWRLVQGEQRLFPQGVELDGATPDFDTVSHNDFGSAHMRTLEGSFSKELPATRGIAVVGGCESVVASLALHMGAVDSAQAAEQLRKAQRQILLNAFDVTCVVRHAAAGSGSGSNASGAGGVATSNVTAHLGKAVYAIGALFNHACDPNCFVSFANNPQGSSPMLVVKTIRPVMEGEELTVAYGGIDAFTFHSMRNRVQTLRERYGFVCRCPACLGQVDEPVREAAKAHYTQAADMYQKGRRLIREGNAATAVTVLLQSYEMVMRYICPPPQPPQMMLPKTHDALALAYFHLGDRAKCAEHLIAALETDIAVHAGNANRVQLINEYTRLAFVVENAEEKRRYAEKAVELLQRFYAVSPMLELEIAYTRSSYKAAKAPKAEPATSGS